MPISVDVDSQTGTALVKAAGELAVEDMKTAALAVWSEPGFARRSVLVDLCEATFSFGLGEVQDLATFTRLGSTMEPPARVALVATGNSEFGQLRMYETYRNQPGVEVGVFREWAAAQKWVQEEPVLE
jgi:hypothetical protein